MIEVVDIATARVRRRRPLPPGAWEQLSFVWPMPSVEIVDRPRRLTVLPPERPRTRADCLPGGWNEQRPCPFAGCRHHMYLQVTDKGEIQLNHKDKELWELEETCVLDQAAHGGLHLHEAAPLMGMTPQWMNVIEIGARAKLEGSEALQALVEEDDGQTLGERVLATFAKLAARGQRLASAADICQDLGIDQREGKIRVYDEIESLLRDERLEHDGGRDDGKGQAARLYWLAESR